MWQNPLRPGVLGLTVSGAGNDPLFVSMRIRLEEWEERLRPVLEEEGVELVEAQAQQSRNGMRLRFFVDRDGGIGIEDLARLSRKIGMALERLLQIPGDDRR